MSGIATRLRGSVPGENKDIFGLAPYGEALKVAVQGAVDGASAFLGRICLPVAEEFGLLLRDRVVAWRALNAAKIAEKAEAKLRSSGNTDGLHAHPRVVGAIIEYGSWADSDDIHEMWSGLLASSCTADGTDEENLLFVNILNELSSSEARLLSFACLNAPKTTTPQGLIIGEYFVATPEKLFEVSGLMDIHRLDRELDHLRVLGMIEGGFDVSLGVTEPSPVDVTPTALALNMYVRCQGIRVSAVEYFGLHKSASEGDA
jgi:hypothetical protein